MPALFLFFSKNSLLNMRKKAGMVNRTVIFDNFC